MNRQDAKDAKIIRREEELNHRGTEGTEKHGEELNRQDAKDAKIIRREEELNHRGTEGTEKYGEELNHRDAEIIGRCGGSEGRSGCVIDDPGLVQYALADAAVEEFGREQVYVAVEDAGEFVLHGQQADQAGGVIRLEFDEDIDIALQVEVGAEDRAEERQAADVVALAEGGDLRLRDGDG